MLAECNNRTHALPPYLLLKNACMVTSDSLLGRRRWEKSEETEGSERGDENSSVGVWQL